MFVENPFLDAMIKFGLLGTAGEIVAAFITKKKLAPWNYFYPIIVWAILGVIIKFCFSGFGFFVAGLTEHGYLPEGSVWKAFFMSFFVNAMFGPWVIIIHRFLDGLPYNTLKIRPEGMKGALLTLLWFWIPAHAVTFALNSPYAQMTLAAIWSFVLGLILGIFKNAKTAKKE